MSEFEKDEGDMDKLNPREEIEMLLPWYATGQLDGSDAKRVELYLEEHPDMASQLALVREEMDVSITETEKLGSPRAGQLGTLMRQIEAEGSSRSSPTSGIFAQVGDWIDQLSPKQMGFAAMAALVLIVAQGITIGGLMRGGGGADAPGYETASGPGDVTHAGGTKLLIVFNPEVRALDIEKLMGEINGSIVSGPKAGGYYKILIDGKSLGEAKTERLLKALKARGDIVRFAARSNN